MCTEPAAFRGRAAPFGKLGMISSVMECDSGFASHLSSTRDAVDDTNFSCRDNDPLLHRSQFYLSVSTSKFLDPRRKFASRRFRRCCVFSIALGTSETRIPQPSVRDMQPLVIGVNHKPV